MNWIKRLSISSTCALAFIVLSIGVIPTRSTGFIVMDCTTSFILGWLIGCVMTCVLIVWNNYTFEYKGNKFILKDKNEGRI